jgi:hypothetical protein
MSNTELVIGSLIGIFLMLAMFLDWFAPKNEPIFKLKNPEDKHLDIKITIKIESIKDKQSDMEKSEDKESDNCPT